jgi:hypothetical protein
LRAAAAVHRNTVRQQWNPLAHRAVSVAGRELLRVSWGKGEACDLWGGTRARAAGRMLWRECRNLQEAECSRDCVQV